MEDSEGFGAPALDFKASIACVCVYVCVCVCMCMTDGWTCQMDGHDRRTCQMDGHDRRTSQTEEYILG